MVKTKNYYKNSHYLIIESHLYVVTFFIWHQEVSPNQEVDLHRGDIPITSTAGVITKVAFVLCQM